MIDSQEIIERSLYEAILHTAIKLGYALNPLDYLPINCTNQKKYEEDLSKLSKHPIFIFGTGNNQSKGQEITPRIVINARGFYPGSVGLPKELISKEEGIGFTSSEFPYEAMDQVIDIHLVANNQEDLRLLHQILFFSIPQRGYLKPYTEEEFLFSGNIFLELTNFYDSPSRAQGIMEKVYQFEVHDCLIGVSEKPADLVPIQDISLLIDSYGVPEQVLHINNS